MCTNASEPITVDKCFHTKKEMKQKKQKRKQKEGDDGCIDGAKGGSVLKGCVGIGMVVQRDV